MKTVHFEMLTEEMVQHKEKLNISVGTHPLKFHADEVMAIAMFIWQIGVLCKCAVPEILTS